MNIDDIKAKLIEGHFEFSRHALKRSVERNISELEIQEAGQIVEIIENYPSDKYSPSCLLLGFTKSRRPLHLQVCYSSDEMLKIITIYEPEIMEWIDFKIRRQK